jgi:outer membrane protein assembly factor BamB
MNRVDIWFVVLSSSIAALPAGAGWRIPFDESGSGPVVVNGVLFVGAGDGAVYALDRATGATKWRFQTGENLSPATSIGQIVAAPPGSGIAGQMAAGMAALEARRQAGQRRIDMIPAVDGGTVFVGSGDHSLYALDAATGQRKWSYLAGIGMANENNSGLPIRAPLVVEAVVYVATEGALHAVDAQSGQRKWLFQPVHGDADVDDERKGVPDGPVLGNGMLFVTSWPLGYAPESQNTFVHAIDAGTGEAKWIASVPSRDASAPLFASERVFFSVAESSLDVSPAGTVANDSPVATLYALHASNGEIAWQLEAPLGFSGTHMLVAGNNIYFATDRKLLAATLETGQELWTFDAETIVGPLAADEQRLFVVTSRDSFAASEQLHALDLAKGSEEWSQRLRGGGSLLAGEGAVHTGSGAFAAAAGKKLWSIREANASARLLDDGMLFIAAPTKSYFGVDNVDRGYLSAVDAATGKR